MRVFWVVLLVTFLSGCNFWHQSEIESCHNKVHSGAKHQAEILSTNIRQGGYSYHSSENGKMIIEGGAKLQNGYGAWTNYNYKCLVSNSGYISDFDLNEGYKSF
ncbi:hypothetical protein [Idiomarina sp.]|uniref:hypothetical protein n=1 Tax=Idiomarina sp. TaxID=1874361 RepID=UPI0025C124EC|nr:hypothetical protein [Idiomarina sp.]